MKVKSALSCISLITLMLFLSVKSYANNIKSNQLPGTINSKGMIMLAKGQYYVPPTSKCACNHCSCSSCEQACRSCQI